MIILKFSAHYLVQIRRNHSSKSDQKLWKWRFKVNLHDFLRTSCFWKYYSEKGSILLAEIPQSMTLEKTKFTS